ncbi:MAG: esterase [Betaproteobacteria bacterium]|jgi:predicted esterase YcpF (UPF0227 family)|nr:MAG: esterase [Betaproteobacteria bacterium]
MIIYVHGFNSSPASHKASMLRKRLAAIGRDSEFVCPALSYSPQRALARLAEELAKAEPESVTLVGSSLGGFYSTWLTEHVGCRTVLVNPAITPHEGLRAYLGNQRNLYTDEEYEFTQSHLAQLKDIYIPRPVRMDRYFLIHTTGDELLDWRVAVKRYGGCRQMVVDGSDHGFAEFGDYIDCVLEFAAN